MQDKGDCDSLKPKQARWCLTSVIPEVPISHVIKFRRCVARHKWIKYCVFPLSALPIEETLCGESGVVPFTTPFEA